MFEKTEVGSGKSPVKAGDIELYFMFSHVKYNFFLIFAHMKMIFVFKYILYLNNIILYFITLYIINIK